MKVKLGAYNLNEKGLLVNTNGQKFILSEQVVDEFSEKLPVLINFGQKCFNVDNAKDTPDPVGILNSVETYKKGNIIIVTGDVEITNDKVYDVHGCLPSFCIRGLANGDCANYKVTEIISWDVEIYGGLA
ncbi:hypothetical protein [Aeromonas phage AS-zj]|uniref:Uncharacterized protein n=1 Tax=Aeromonas phage AS-zj TaxID=2024208 RepID=A0A223LFD6_9CAUD|nr:hypothetical protein HWB28_gp340 [Aeromonas phage AS-zj]ASU00212.1 hypothetical protein [Aeromonas phage AS-zj]UKM62861.1 hypothetical protein P19_0373 [Aeromonas phage P19]